MRNFNKLIDHVNWMECIVKWNTAEGATIGSMVQGGRWDKSAFGNMDDSWAQSQKTWQRAGVRSRVEEQGIYSMSGTQGYNLQCPSLPNYSVYSGNLSFNSGKQSRGLFTKDMNALWRVFKFLVWVLAAWSKYLISFWHLRIPKPSLKWECQSWIIRNKRKPSTKKPKFKEEREIQKI